ncbi:hypothetical protein BGW80DRAFT_218534 [Lactifluus volemus]|nr:hypothetical protein BGW80DRAFT_218534 [Lactifluus volemus]
MEDIEILSHVRNLLSNIAYSTSLVPPSRSQILTLLCYLDLCHFKKYWIVSRRYLRFLFCGCFILRQ